ncbi:MAG TPA: hypothetical protein EYP81_02200 [Thermodesulfobacteriaceae bacterium]|nr:hypothetical protein [Thermodesulfobacteriaceae bacterium]
MEARAFLTAKEARLIPVVTFVGFVEKRALVEAVAQELKGRGYKVGLIREKSSPVKTSSLPFPGQAEVNFGQISLVQELDHEDFEHLIYRLFEGYDIVLGEGFVEIESIPKIEVARASVSRNLFKGKISGVLAVVSDFEVPGSRSFPFEAISEIASFIEEHILLPLKRDVKTVLFVNGRRIPIKKYVRETLAGVIEGFVSRLKMTEGAREIEIKIRLE